MSHAWSLEFPGTNVKTLTRDVSDHVPCAIIIQNKVPKSRVKMVIQFLYMIEESRDLKIHEWNFWDILQNQLSTLLEWKKCTRGKEGGSNG
jgi:hypothetical protein